MTNSCHVIIKTGSDHKDLLNKEIALNSASHITIMFNAEKSQDTFNIQFGYLEQGLDLNIVAGLSNYYKLLRNQHVFS